MMQMAQQTTSVWKEWAYKNEPLLHDLIMFYYILKYFSISYFRFLNIKIYAHLQVQIMSANNSTQVLSGACPAGIF